MSIASLRKAEQIREQRIILDEQRTAVTSQLEQELRTAGFIKPDELNEDIQISKMDLPEGIDLFSILNPNPKEYIHLGSPKQNFEFILYYDSRLKTTPICYIKLEAGLNDPIHLPGKVFDVLVKPEQLEEEIITCEDLNLEYNTNLGLQMIVENIDPSKISRIVTKFIIKSYEHLSGLGLSRRA